MIIPESMGPISFAYDGKLSADAEAVVRALVSSTFLSLGKGVRKETRWSTLSAFNFLMTHGWDAVLRKAESQLREVTRVKARCLAVNVVLGHVLRTRPPLPDSTAEHDALASLENPSDPLLRTAIELGLLLAPEALDYAQVSYDIYGPELWLTSEEGFEAMEQEIRELMDLRDILRAREERL